MNGFYINLEKRKDRNEHIIKLKENNTFFKNINRFNAIYNDKYGVGCLESHIKCLELCLKMNDNYYLIIEDDFFILNQQNFNEFVNEFETIKNENWDVITLTPRGITKKKQFLRNFHRIIETQTATAYIIKHNFIQKLLPILVNSLPKLKNAKNKKESHPYFNDQCWKPLQKKSIWLYFNKIFAGQLPCYSDIEKRNVNYNKRFLDQLKY